MIMVEFQRTFARFSQGGTCKCYGQPAMWQAHGVVEILEDQNKSS